MLSRRQTFGLFASSTLLAYSPAWADNHDVWALDTLHDAPHTKLHMHTRTHTHKHAYCNRLCDFHF